MCPTPLRPEERQTTVVDHERDGMRLQIRTPGDLESMELVACERVPPGPGQIEVAVSASSINFADVLVAFGRYPAFEGRLPQLGTDFAGVVTAVGPDVTDHKVGDHVGGLSANGCWGTFLTCDARLAVTLPAGLTDEQAAAVTTAHATAYYGLHRAGPHQERRQGVDPFRDRGRRAGGNRHRPRRGSRDLRHRRQRAASTIVARHGD